MFSIRSYTLIAIQASILFYAFLEVWIQCVGEVKMAQFDDGLIEQQIIY
jgi:hypothetical protein